MAEPYRKAKAKREDDDVRVLATMAGHEGHAWTMLALWHELPDMTSDRLRGALTRLAVRGQVQQESAGQANHYHWRLVPPLQEG